MDQNNNQQHQHGCMCGQWGGHYGHFYVLRWVLGILIILMIFSFGMQIGEFKAQIENGMGGYSHHDMMYYGSAPMIMRSGASAAMGMPTTAPASAAATAK